MLKTYCQKCGSPNDYISQKPKFCGECGEPMSVSVASSPTSTSYTRKPGLTKVKPLNNNNNNTSNIADDDFHSYSHIDPENDDFVFEADTIQKNNSTITLGQIGYERKTNFKRDITPVNIDNEQFKKNYQSQAANNGKPIEDSE